MARFGTPPMQAAADPLPPHTRSERRSPLPTDSHKFFDGLRLRITLRDSSCRRSSTTRLVEVGDREKLFAFLAVHLHRKRAADDEPHLILLNQKLDGH